MYIVVMKALACQLQIRGSKSKSWLGYRDATISDDLDHKSTMGCFLSPQSKRLHEAVQ